MIFAQRQKSKGLNSPVIIGGIGGSGTRVLTEILQLFGFFLGKDLNIALDNESFTLLFKHPSWLHQNINNPEIISSRLSLFKKAMTCTQPFTKNELQTLDDITRIMAVNGHNLNNNEGYGEWAYYRKKKIMVESGFREGNYTGWGWKEPNSYLLLDHYPEVFPGFRYIHVIRHGLDMAFSKNQNQLYNWGGGIWGSLAKIGI